MAKNSLQKPSAALSESFFIGDDLGITPAVQSKLDVAAALCRRAFTEIEAALDVSDPGTDAERRCNEALNELDGVLFHLEWAPPRETTNG